MIGPDQSFSELGFAQFVLFHQNSNGSIVFLMEMKGMNIHQLSHTTFEIQVVIENPCGIEFLMQCQTSDTIWIIQWMLLKSPWKSGEWLEEGIEKKAQIPFFRDTPYQ